MADLSQDCGLHETWHPSEALLLMLFKPGQHIQVAWAKRQGQEKTVHPPVRIQESCWHMPPSHSPATPPPRPGLSLFSHLINGAPEGQTTWDLPRVGEWLVKQDLAHLAWPTV